MTDAPPDELILERIETTIGQALVVVDPQGVLRAFNWRDYEDAMRRWLGRHYAGVPLGEGAAPGPVRDALRAYFAGDRTALAAVPWRASGTAFQQRVWRALCDIPPGETLSYGQLAAKLGKPTAMRAVGLANGANPVALVVPCHRVIGANGTLTGYGGGLQRKRWLLAHEGARFREALAA
jgi:methylated-DNA-[protein]-cysteine S-methyltransferase